MKIRVRNYEHLYTTDENGDQVLNDHSVNETYAYAEPALGKAEPGEKFQFFRHGYYVADSRLCTDDEKVFNRIVELKSSWKPAK